MSMKDERVARSVALEKAYVHDVYEQFSDEPCGRPWPKVTQFLQDLEPGSLVCDVGCGNGKYLGSNPSVFNIGSDKCVRFSKIAREKENEILICDNLSLPFRDESFDAVLSVAVVHHFATTERRVCALRELARILRIGGRLIISVWAMEQTHRKFESQDVLVPWHRPQMLSTPSLELTSTTNTSEEDALPPYHAYTQTSDTDSNKSIRTRMGLRKRAKTRHKGRSIDPGHSSSPSSSSLSSPNETCYSFVRRALQKLAGGKRSGTSHRPWFLDTWNSCTKEPTPKRYEHEECYECGNIQDLPIELRRVDDDEMPQRRQTFPSSQIVVGGEFYGLKSKSLSDIKTCEERGMVRSQSGTPSIQQDISEGKEEEVCVSKLTSLKPKLVKQKHSICDEDAEEALDKPTDMHNLISALPDFRMYPGTPRSSVFKQRSMNEELMSAERLREKEQVKQNIHKQASLNEDLICHRHTSLKDSFFSVSTSKRFQLIKSGFTNTFKNSTTNIEKVAGSSLKNGFVRMFQGWKGNELVIATSQTEMEPTTNATNTTPTKSVEKPSATAGERRHSREDGSDSSKDSSLQSDTSVDSEDSFASVIFIPKTDPLSPVPLSPGPKQTVPNSPRIKQSSCPTSPRVKQMPNVIYPLTKQLSSTTTGSPTLTWTTINFSAAPTTTETTTTTVTPMPTETANSLLTKQLRSPTTASDSALESTIIHPNLNNKQVNSTTTLTTSPFSSTTPTPTKTTVLVSTTETASYPLMKSTPVCTNTSNDALFLTTSFPNVNNTQVSLTTLTTSPLNSTAPTLTWTSTSNSTSQSISYPNIVALQSMPETTSFPNIQLSSTTTTLTTSPLSSTTPTPTWTTTGNGAFHLTASYSNINSKQLNLATTTITSPLSSTTLTPTWTSTTSTQSSTNNSTIPLTTSYPNSNNKQLNSTTTSTFPLTHPASLAQKYSVGTIPEFKRPTNSLATNSLKRSERLRQIRELLNQRPGFGMRSSRSTFPLVRHASIRSGSNGDVIARPLPKLLSLELFNPETDDKDSDSSGVSSPDSVDSVINLEVSDNGKGTKIPFKKLSLPTKFPFPRTETLPDFSLEEIKRKSPSSVRLLEAAANVANSLDEAVDAVMRCSPRHKQLEKNEDSNWDEECHKHLTDFADKLSEKLLLEIDQYQEQSKRSEKEVKFNDPYISRLSEELNDLNKLSAEIQKQNQFLSQLRTTDHSVNSERICTESAQVPNLVKSSDAHCSVDSASDSQRDECGSTVSLTSAQCAGAREPSNYSDASQESLPSDGVGGAITYHRYYHVFREGELDQLIERYVENLHIISSYYDHASWCVVAEKVQVWTI